MSEFQESNESYEYAEEDQVDERDVDYEEEIGVSDDFQGEGEGEEEDVEDPSNDFEATEHDNDEAFLHATVPENFKALRACLRCYLIKSFDQFFEEGCENCDFLNIAESSERVHECTTAYFEGMVAILEPEGSWVTKYQRMTMNIPGLYAIEVAGQLPKNDIEICKNSGYTYRLTDVK